MRPFFPLATISLALWLLLAGCSADNSTLGASTGTGGSGSGSTSAAGVGGASAAAVREYCDATAGPFCEAVFACCATASNGYGTVETCKQRFRYSGESCLWGGGQYYEASIDAGHTGFDQAKLDACVAHLKSMSAGGAACVQAPAAFYKGICPTVFQGQLAPGEPCTWLPGILQNTATCMHGYCDKFTNTCVRLAQPGELCNADAPPPYPNCEYGQEVICSNQPYPNGPLTCVHLGDIGEPCVQQADCKSFNCDTTSGTCAPPEGVGLCLGP